MAIINGNNEDNNLVGFNSQHWAIIDGEYVLYPNGNDTINGNGGEDTLDGGDGDDELYGGNGNDELYGGNGNDFLQGGSQNDILLGGRGTDDLEGGAGDDTLSGGLGTDTFDGGAGNDTADYAYSFTPDGIEANLADGTVEFVDGGEVESLESIENLVGSQNDDDINGSDGDNILDGSNGDDIIDGKLGNDTVIGGNGDDIIHGNLDGNTTDILDGGAGIDTVTYEFFDTPNGLEVQLPEDNEIGHAQFVDLNVNDDLLSIENFVGTQNGDEINGSNGDNILDGSGGYDVIYGYSGNDTLIGGNDNVGNDLYGQEGNDSLEGSNGDDFEISGGAGDDTLTGGLGSDRFTFNPSFGSGSGSDIITDFEPGVDRIEIINNGNFTFSDLEFNVDGVLDAGDVGGGVVSIIDSNLVLDLSGFPSIDNAEITLQNITSLDSTDIVFI